MSKRPQDKIPGFPTRRRLMTFCDNAAMSVTGHKDRTIRVFNQMTMAAQALDDMTDNDYLEVANNYRKLLESAQCL